MYVNYCRHIGICFELCLQNYPPHYVIKGILVSYNKKGDFVAQLSACATLLGSTR